MANKITSKETISEIYMSKTMEFDMEAISTIFHNQLFQIVHHLTTNNMVNRKIPILMKEKAIQSKSRSDIGLKSREKILVKIIDDQRSKGNNR